MTDYSAPPNQTKLILNAFDKLSVNSGGTATGTVINNDAVGNVYAGGKVVSTIVNASGVLNVGGTGIGTIINNFGNENVFGGGTVTGTTINAGGAELVNAGTTAINTIINGGDPIQQLGGVQEVLGTAIGTIINDGGTQDVSGTAIGTIINPDGLQSVSGTAKGTIINGGLESVLSGGVADGVDFVGPNSTLVLATPSGLTGFVLNWEVGDKIHFVNTKVTSVNESGITLTVTYGDHETASYSLAGQQANTEFKLENDGHGGTNLILTMSGVGGPPPLLLEAIENYTLAITRTALPLDQATSIENSINAGTQTEAQYVSGLHSQVANTTIPTVAVEATMYGAVGSSAEITILVMNFLPTQVANALHYGLNAQVYACEALGLAFAFGNENGSTAFANNFGPSNAAMPNTTTGDATFAAAAASAIFGSAATVNTPIAIQTWVANWKAFYAINGVVGVPNATADQIDLAARGAAWGDAVGVALANNLGLLPAQVTNFLENAAQGTAVYSASLSSQPIAAPFQGAPTAPDAGVQLVGIGAELDQFQLG